VRLGDPVGALLLAQELFRAVLNIVIHLLQMRGPFGFGRLYGLLLGIKRSFELKIDSPRMVYRVCN
jgi:hypothetical protein